MDDKPDDLIHNKSLPLRMMGTLSLLFKGDIDATVQELIDDQKTPESQKILAIHQAGLRKRKGLRPLFVEVATRSQSRGMAIAAVQALIRTGDLYDPDLPSSLIVDITEMYLNTLDAKLYAALHRLLLEQKGLPVFRILATTLMERYELFQEINAQSWEILTRALHLGYSYHHPAFVKAVKKEEEKITYPHDNLREKIERQSVHIKGAIKLAEKVREELSKRLEGHKKGEAITIILYSASLYKSFHEKCGFARVLKPLFDGLTDSRPGIRSVAADELSRIYTPLAFDYYKEVVMGNIKIFPDTIKSVASIVGALAAKNREAMELLFYLIPSFPQEDSMALIDVIANLARNRELAGYMTVHVRELLRRGGLHERLAQELITQVLSGEPNEETIRFLLDVVEAKIPASLGVQKRCIRLLLGFNSPDFPLISPILQKIARDGTVHDLRLFVYQEMKEAPAEENLTILRDGIYDPVEEVRKAALSTYCEMVAKSAVDRSKAFRFMGTLLEKEDKALDPGIKVHLLSFLKASRLRDHELRKNIYLLLVNNDKFLRTQAFEVLILWLQAPSDQDEEWEIVQVMLEILSTRGFEFDDGFLKAGKSVSEFMTGGSPTVTKHLQDILNALERGISQTASAFQIGIICEILENASGSQSSHLKLQVQWLMEKLLKKPLVSPLAQLHIVQSLIFKEGKMIQYFPRLLQIMAVDDPAVRKIALETLASESALFQKWSIEEKLDVLVRRKAGAIAAHIQWEIATNRDLLPLLKRILADPSTTEDIIVLVITIMRRLECARLDVAFLFRYQEEQYSDLIREKALESLACLLYKPFSAEETEIIQKLKSIASDPETAFNYRRSALMALVRIGSDEFYSFFVDMVREDQERNDIRILAIQGLNSLRNMKALDIYLPALRNPWYNIMQKEAVLDGLSVMGTSAMIEPLLSLIFGSENQKLVDKAQNALVERGYGQFIELRAGNVEVQNRRNDMETLNRTAQLNREKCAVMGRALEQVEKETEEKRGELALHQKMMSDEEEKAQKTTVAMEQQKYALDVRIREFIPGWPHERKMPSEAREQLLPLREEYEEFMNQFQTVKNEHQFHREGIQKECDRLQHELDSICQKAEKLRAEMAPLQEEAEHCSKEAAALEQFVRERQDELMAMEASLREHLPSIDQQNREHIRAYWQQRAGELSSRWKYFTALKQLAGLEKVQGGQERGRAIDI